MATGLTDEFGLTVMEKDEGVPAHPFAVGVIVMVEIIGDVVELVAVKDGISPVPFAARPIEVLLLVQL